MSKSRRNLDYLLDIQDAIERALEYTNGLTWDEYLHDNKTQDAVVRNLEVLGETTKNISDDLRIEYPAVPWRDMSGTRDRLVHHYFGISQEIVWQIVQKDLPGLKQQIANMISEISAGDA
jgi:uncharacterized protein with HEPN domain